MIKNQTDMFPCEESFARIRKAEALNSRPKGRFVQCMTFAKAERRALLSVYEHQMELNGYHDPNFSHQLDWNDPDIAIEGASPEKGFNQFNILEVCSKLFDRGWVPLKTIDADEIEARDRMEEAEVSRCVEEITSRPAAIDTPEGRLKIARYSLKLDRRDYERVKKSPWYTEDMRARVLKQINRKIMRDLAAISALSREIRNKTDNPREPELPLNWN